MIEIDDALQAILKRAQPLTARLEPLRAVNGLILAEDARADQDSPPFDKALVDGFAIRSIDWSGRDSSFRIVEEIPAGHFPVHALGVNESSSIMTGAPLPQNADAVLMVERSRPLGKDCVAFDFSDLIRPGMNILRRGREMRGGDIVLSKGTTLTPVRMGILATIGRAEVLVVPRPKVLIVPTGDELVEPDRVPGPGQIRNGNATILAALAENCGTDVATTSIVPDDSARLREALTRGLVEADLLLITGGVSAGTRDLVPGALQSLGVERVFHQVNIRPGKPLWFGIGPNRTEGRPPTLVFGLPGNPVSGIIGFMVFARTALNVMSGGAISSGRKTHARLKAAFRHRGSRPTYHPTLLTGEGADVLALPLDWAGSADLLAVARADGFSFFPGGDRDFQPGESVEILL